MPHGPTGKTCPQLLVCLQELRQREPCKVERHGVTSIHHRSGKSKRKARSSLSAEVQALADAEQGEISTRLHMGELLGFVVNLGNVDETVQRVGGVLVIDAKATYDLV